MAMRLHAQRITGVKRSRPYSRRVCDVQLGDVNRRNCGEWPQEPVCVFSRLNVDGLVLTPAPLPLASGRGSWNVSAAVSRRRPAVWTLRAAPR